MKTRNELLINMKERNDNMWKLLLLIDNIIIMYYYY